MKDLWLEDLADLVKTTDFPLGPPAVKEGLPSIALPVDVGADRLLEQYAKEPPQWNALEVENLVELLSNRVAACVSLRDRAQYLEIEALEAFLAFQRNSGLLELEEKEVELREKWEPKLAQNRIDETTNSSYWSALTKIGVERIALAREILRQRKDKSTSRGNGSNLVERFEDLKRAFYARLVESYRLARSVSAGLKAVYDLQEDPPALTEVGYLNELALWTGKVVETLDRVLSHRAETTLVVPVGSYAAAAVENPIIESAAFTAGITAGLLAFPLDSAALAKFVDTPASLRNPRLRAVRPFVVRASSGISDCWKMRIDLPKQSVAGQSIVRVLQTVAPTMELVTFADLPWSSAVHNVSPLGEWELRIGKFGLLQRAAWDAKNTLTLAMLMRISYDVEI